MIIIIIISTINSIYYSIWCCADSNDGDKCHKISGVEEQYNSFFWGLLKEGNMVNSHIQKNLEKPGSLLELHGMLFLLLSLLKVIFFPQRNR